MVEIDILFFCNFSMPERMKLEYSFSRVITPAWLSFFIIGLRDLLDGASEDVIGWPKHSQLPRNFTKRRSSQSNQSGRADATLLLYASPALSYRTYRIIP